MKVKKVEDVKYALTQPNGDLHLSLVWKDSEVYIAMSNLLIKDGEIWYEIPVKDLENIDVVGENPLRLRFKLPLIDVTLSGERATRLLALRHFLLPYIDGEAIKDELMESFLKFWCVGITNPHALAILLEVDEGKVGALLTQAKGKGYISEKGKLTQSALALFSDKDREMLLKGGSCE